MQVIDAWVNFRMPETPAAWQQQVAEQLFKRSAGEVFRKMSGAELLEQMDASSIERAILTVRADRPSKEVLALAEQHPHRFAVSAIVDPRLGMKAVRDVDALARQHPLKLARVIPSMLSLPPDDRVYYPLYARCVDLGLPISVNTGIPGPRLPGRCQDPMNLDEVCLFFPELTVIMAHGADPWWAVAIRLMLKYSNLYLMTSAYAPRYLPAELIQYMNTRGRDKVMFATDFPFLPFERCVAEAHALDLRDGVLEQFLHANAARVLLGQS